MGHEMKICRQYIDLKHIYIAMKKCLFMLPTREALQILLNGTKDKLRDLEIKPLQFIRTLKVVYSLCHLSITKCSHCQRL